MGCGLMQETIQNKNRGDQITNKSNTMRSPYFYKSGE